MADKFVKHIDGRLFRYCDDDYDNKKTVESGQFKTVNMDDMVADIIYLSKYTIHTGSDEADFSYALKAWISFKNPC